MAWNKAAPVAGSYANLLMATIRANNTGIEAALDNEHDFTTGATLTGRHTQGSARCFWQATAPATRIDGTSFTSVDLGSIWIDSDDNKIYVLTAITPTWTYIGTEFFAALLAVARIFASTLGVTGDFAVNTDKLTVAAATGNVAVAGNVAVTGNIAVAGLATIADTLGVTGVATLGDGSALASSAAPDSDVKLANKKYVDDQIASARLLYSGATVFNATLTSSDTWQNLDLSSIVGAKRAMCFFHIYASAAVHYAMRTKGISSGTVDDYTGNGDRGAAHHYAGAAGYSSMFVCSTDANGILQHGATNISATMTVKLLHYLVG